MVQQGFKFAEVLNAWDSFVQISEDDKFYFPPIKDIAHQFDEYEALLATGLHYSVRIAVNGETGNVKDFIRDFIDGISDSDNSRTSFDIKLPVSVQKTSSLPKLSGQFTVPIFPNSVLTIGGVGENSVRMKHLIGSNIHFPSVLNASEESIDIDSVILGENSLFYERLYSTLVNVTQYQGEDLKRSQIYLFGGRKAPSQPCSNDLFLLQIHDKEDSLVEGDQRTDKDFSISAKVIATDESKPCPRWRHAMAFIDDENFPSLILFGGRNTEVMKNRPYVHANYLRHDTLFLSFALQNVLADFWRFNLETSEWTNETDEIKGPDNMIPSGRHSHCMITHPSGKSAYLVGGISANDVALCRDSFWIFQNNKEWTPVHHLKDVCRRTGHTIAMHNNKLIILGGYGADSSYSLDFTVICIDLLSYSHQLFVPVRGFN